MHENPKSVKFQLSHQYLFTLLGSTSAKAVRKTLMKFTPVHITKIQKVQIPYVLAPFTRFSQDLNEAFFQLAFVPWSSGST